LTGGFLSRSISDSQGAAGKQATTRQSFARSPAVFTGTTAMWAAVRSFEKIDAQLKRLVNRRVAWWNGCQF
jgi:hypothetical protein